MNILATPLYPIIELMKAVLNFYQSVFGSWGVAILVLSISTSILMLPLQRFGRSIERKIQVRTQLVNTEIAKLDSGLKGEKRFNEVEKIYQANHYHPIQQIGNAASIFVLLPVLISAVIVFQQFPPMIGNGFLLVEDLSRPDGLLSGFNLLPLILFVVTLIDALDRFNNDKSGFCQFMLLSIFLITLVYNLPAALLLFWIGSNIVSILVYRINPAVTPILK